MGYLDNKNGHPQGKVDFTDKSGEENTTNPEDQCPGASKASGSLRESSPSSLATGYWDNKNGDEQEKVRHTGMSGGANPKDQCPEASKAKTVGKSSQYPSKNKQYSNDANRSVHSYSQNDTEQNVDLEFEPLDLSQPHLRA